MEMDDSLRLSLVPGVALTEPSPGKLALTGARVEIPLENISAEVARLIRRLAGGPVSERELLSAAAGAGDVAATELSFCLLLLAGEGLLCRSVMAGGEPLFTCVPLAAGDDVERPPFDPRSRYRLSRFAYCRRAGDTLVLESPLSHAQVVLHDWRGAALVAALAQPSRPIDLGAAIPGLGEPGAKLATELLWDANVLTIAEAGASMAEDLQSPLAPWEFHDLVFHCRSRQGRHAAGYGQTNRLVKQIDSPPAVKPAMSADFLDLARPDIDALVAADLPFTRVLERRHSERRHGPQPITLRQLADFLYRSLRVRRTAARSGEEFTGRVYPGAGSAYELEFYLVVHSCAGLAPAIYHYQPIEHRLYRLASRPEDADCLLDSAARTAGSPTPQVLIVAAARFARIMRRYESIGYALILKDVGAVFQTMYLVAAAMNLAACALGGGDSDAFARAAGTDYYAETSVGEFMLGAAPAAE